MELEELVKAIIAGVVLLTSIGIIVYFFNGRGGELVESIKRPFGFG
jgi:hypothetical protein